MRITAQAVKILSGILSTCMFEKGYILSEKQRCFLKEVSSEDSFEDFCLIFPLEEETKGKLISLAESLRKKAIDSEVVLDFFGGDLHIDHAREDVADNGLTGVLANLFLIFHVVICVRLSKKGGLIVGEYINDDVKFELRGLEVMDGVEVDLNDANQVALVHYGSVFGGVPVGSDEEKYLLAAQSRSQFFRDTCRKIKFLDCEKMLKALQFKKKFCHTNPAG